MSENENRDIEMKNALKDAEKRGRRKGRLARIRNFFIGVICGMLILTIRDLALGMFNLGSGYSIGRGFLRADKLTIRRGNASTAVIKFVYEASRSVCAGMEVSDPDGIIDKCMQALRKFPACTSGKESK